MMLFPSKIMMDINYGQATIGNLVDELCKIVVSADAVCVRLQVKVHLNDKL